MTTIRNTYLSSRGIGFNEVLQFLTIRSHGYRWPVMFGRWAGGPDYGLHLSKIRVKLATLIMESELPDDMYEPATPPRSIKLKTITDEDVALLAQCDVQEQTGWTLEDALLVHLLDGVCHGNSWAEFHRLIIEDLTDSRWFRKEGL